MLDYEKEILEQMMEEDGLLIMARGLGIERILQSLMAAHCQPSNLVLVIGTSPQEAEYLVAEMPRALGVTCETPPRCVTAEVSVSDRASVYQEGGVLFVTSRILVVDFLMNRVPAKQITGIIVWKAHKILESCQEAFILRLYRQKNKTGFVKALSGSSLSFTQGFCQVGRVMRNLFVKKLYLYPRFHLSVTENLAVRKPEVVELHLKMTPRMKDLQSSLVDLVSSTVHELRLVNKGLMDNDLLTTEHALSPMFDRMVMSLLQPLWDQLPTRTRHLVGDLRLLRMLNSYLCQYDCITFYNLTASLRTTEKALHSSGWMMLPPAESLFLSAKKRVFGDNPSEALTNIRKRSEKALKDTEEINPLGLTPEINPKWDCLKEILAEVRASAAKSEGPLVERCLIVTQDDTSAQQLQQVIVDGSERVLLRLFYQTLGAKMNLTPPPQLFSRNSKPDFKKKKKRKRVSAVNEASVSQADQESSKRIKEFLETKDGTDKNTNEGKESQEGDAQTSVAPENTAGKSGENSTAPSDEKTTGNSVEDANLGETIPLIQIQERYKFVGDSSDSESSEGEDEEEKEKRMQAKREKKEKLKQKDEERKRRKNLFSSPLILVQSLKNFSEPFSLPRVLRDVQPRYIIMYDSDLEFIRQVETWQADGAPHQCLVYLMIYKGTTEEQLYLTQVKREKDAFHYLIKEKAGLVLPEDAEGRTEDHPDLQRDPRTAAEMAVSVQNSNRDTRKGGHQQTEEDEERIIVDMREFRSQLPSLIHKRGIEIDPVTIEVGDYILTPEMCVERKSLNDLVGSLNNGRLYSQSVSMTRHYAKPMLLIEFDHNKPFHLQASVFTSARGASGFGSLTQGEPDNRDVYSKLQLLTLHFPRMRLLWCSSPYATAEMFHLLKAGKPQPDVEKAQAIKGDSISLDDAEKFNPIIHDFMSKLPGVTTKNIHSLLRKATDLPTLLSMDKQTLTDILGNSINAAQLHSALHCTLKEEDVMQEANRKAKAKLTRKGLPKFGSGS